MWRRPVYNSTGSYGRRCQNTAKFAVCISINTVGNLIYLLSLGDKSLTAADVSPFKPPWPTTPCQPRKLQE